jgi:hypothetical protein
MKKLIPLLIISVLLIATSCTQQTQMTSTATETAKEQSNTPQQTVSLTQMPEDSSEELQEEQESDQQSQTETLIGTYPIVDTNQTDFYSDSSKISEPSKGNAFYGQDASYSGNQPSYTDNGDGTVTENVTGLMWQQTMDEKMTFSEASQYTQSNTLAGYDDWRVPTIKELWSLMDYTGQSGGETAIKLYIDTNYFDQPTGDTSKGEREIDAQVWSATEYTGLTMGGSQTVFGVNFVDGRIKGYPSYDPRLHSEKTMYVRLVRGNTDYGINNFADNNDGTVSDLATGLMWRAEDDGETRDWEDALYYAENSDYAGYDDWRLPNAKELQSIVDYTNSLQENGKAAISDLFELTKITDVRGQADYGFYWTSTTHLDGRNPYASAAYVCFGEALGEMNGRVMDVHGAGALRSDPKSGDADEYPQYFGPQGDIRYVYNFCLLVRDID